MVSALLEKEALPSPALETEIALGASDERYARNYIRILDAHGSVFAETPGMDGRVPVSLFPGASSAEIDGIDARPYCLLQAALPAASARPGWKIQAALDVSTEEGLGSRTLILLTGVLAAGMALAVAAGWLVARRGLKPLARIARTAQRITASNLEARLGDAAWPTELETLAAVFDDMLDRLDGSFRRLSDFSGNLAHELRTPINNLMGEVEVALGQDRTPEEYRRILFSAAEEQRRLARLVDNLLFLARTDAASPLGAQDPIDVRAAIDHVCDYYASLAEDRSIALSCEGQARLGADQQLLQRAVGNLVSNALNHTPAGGEIRVSLGEREAGVEILVADSGAGIPPEDLPRAFERFYRAAAARARHPEGSGLGLAIVKSILELHGGAAGIESQAGRGTTVRLFFPKITKL